MEINEFIRKIPKAELHVHLEGTVEPELNFKLAKRNKIELPFENIEHLRSLYNFSNLTSFVELFYQCISSLQTEEDFYDLTLEYIKRVGQDGCRHVEIHFDPECHIRRGMTMASIINGIWRAFQECKSTYGITAYLILCFSTFMSEQEAFDILDQAIPFLNKIKAVGRGGPELGKPIDKFERVYDKARQLGLKCVMHAGEEGPAEHIWASLKQMKVARIDHGVTCDQDEKLLKELVEKQVPLTICPISNVKLKVFKSMEDHNLKKILDMGIKVTINSDDPAYFGGYLFYNYIEVYEKLGLSIDDIVKIAKNSFEASFLPKADIEKHLLEIDSFYMSFKQKQPKT